MKHGKKYVDAAKLVDRTKLYDTAEALETVIKTAPAKFDETVELHIKLGVDSRHADQQVRGAVVLPNGTGKKVRVSKLSSRNDFVGGVRANKVANATTTKQIKVKGLKKSEVNKYIKLIKNGSLTKDAIKSIKNEKLKTFIENYQTYYDKAQEAKKAVQENITSIVELNKQKLNNII